MALDAESPSVSYCSNFHFRLSKRFKRANQSEGGFGIGLDIVNQVVNSYHFHLDITSKLHLGTKVEIISRDTREGEQFYELGGIGAILRYEIE